MTSDAAPPSGGPSPHRFIGMTLLALCAAMFAVWAFVLRPAVDDAERSNGTAIAPDDLVQAEAGTDRSTADGELIRVDAPVPDVTLVGLDGPNVQTSDLRGTVTVINFWASTCAPCVKEMPLLEGLHQRLGDEVRFLGVDVFESPDLGREMIATTGVTYPQTVDPTNEVLTTFGGIQLPHTVVLRADGTVAAIHNEVLDDEQEVLDLIDRATQ